MLTLERCDGKLWVHSFGTVECGMVESSLVEDGGVESGMIIVIRKGLRELSQRQIREILCLEAR